jgi:recombination protein RecT
MGRKTVIRRLAKFLPLSVEFQTGVALDAMAESGKDQHNDDIDGDFMVTADDAPTSIDYETGEITQPAQIEHQPPAQTLPQQTRQADTADAVWIENGTAGRVREAA